VTFFFVVMALTNESESENQAEPENRRRVLNLDDLPLRRLENASVAEALDPAIPADVDALAKRVLEDACARGLLLATAESCTGGLLASLLTDIPGASHAFERGFVTYTDDAKHEMLGVSRTILETDGAVSEAAARAMAEGALAGSRAQLAASITGFTEGGAGEAGLVPFACARRDGPTRHQVGRFGDIGRAAVRLEALKVSLAMLRDALSDTAGRD
jgi:nicotinamide-nucleotide amidase